MMNTSASTIRANFKRLTIHLIAAARPNFMKIAPLYHALREEAWAVPVIVHTGQHYDLNMSDAFFSDLSIPEPDIHLGVGSGTHAEQTGQVMIAYEKILLKEQPDLVIVVGDVNSTLACTLAARKITYTCSQNIRHNLSHEIHSNDRGANFIRTEPTDNGHGQRPLIAHLEAGLRSFDRTMPEEINRLVTDSLADILWTPSLDGDENLIREGVAREKIVRVGNIMIDSLEMLRDKIEAQAAYEDFGLQSNGYGIVTLHRPSNVDDQKVLKSICQTLARISQEIRLIFPVHPRTLKNLEKNGLMSLLNRAPGLYPIDPLNYIRFMNLVFNSRLVITDSGGIQEETTYLGIPCVTMRPNTERPITIAHGTNQLCNLEDLETKVEAILRDDTRTVSPIEMWDGKTAQRVIMSIRCLLGC